MNIAKLNGVIHALIICVVTGLIMLEAWLFNIKDPTWAIISGVVCSELEMDQAHILVFGRIAATLLGIVIAIIVILILGTGYTAILCGVSVITLICHYVIRLGNNWKLATATGAIIFISSFHHASFSIGVAYQRGLEVAVGSLTAGVVSLIFGKIWFAIKKNTNRE